MQVFLRLFSFFLSLLICNFHGPINRRHLARALIHRYGSLTTISESGTSERSSRGLSSGCKALYALLLKQYLLHLLRVVTCMPASGVRDNAPLAQKKPYLDKERMRQPSIGSYINLLPEQLPGKPTETRGVKRPKIPPGHVVLKDPKTLRDTWS